MNRLKFWGLILALFVCVRSAVALEGIFLGAQLGHVSISGTIGQRHSSSLGFGLDLGLKTSPLLDIMFRLQTSSHSNNGGLNIYSQTISADFHVFEVDDFEFSFGLGPGFYFYKFTPVTNSHFGINLGLNADVKIEEAMRLGLGFRRHFVMGSTADSYMAIMMRFGYWFDLGSG